MDYISAAESIGVSLTTLT